MTDGEELSLWETRERNRLEILAAFDEAEAEPQLGKYDDYSDGTLPLLADQLKSEARSLPSRRQL